MGKVAKKKAPLKEHSKKPSLLHKETNTEQAFLLCTGVPVTSIKGLADELELLDDGVWYYHTQNGRNDFAQWIQDVFDRQDLAEKMRATHSKDQLRAAVYKYLLEGKH